MNIGRIPKDSELALCSFKSTLGNITCAASGTALCGVWMSGQRQFGLPFGIAEAEATSPTRLSSAENMRVWTHDDHPVSDESAAVLEQAHQWIQDFLEGMNPNASELRLATYGTDFQLRIWNALLEIPYGASVTYGQLAHKVGAPRAFQAVGSAVGRNPLSLIVPCHRVTSASGQVHYAGGTQRKLYLFSLESGEGMINSHH